MKKWVLIAGLCLFVAIALVAASWFQDLQAAVSFESESTLPRREMKVLTIVPISWPLKYSFEILDNPDYVVINIMKNPSSDGFVCKLVPRKLGYEETVFVDGAFSANECITSKYLRYWHDDTFLYFEQFRRYPRLLSPDASLMYIK